MKTNNAAVQWQSMFNAFNRIRMPILLWLLLPLCSLNAWGQGLDIRSTFESANLTPYFEYFEDTGAQLDIKQIQQLTNEQWTLSKDTESFNFGYTKSAYWLRITIKNTSNKQRELFLDIAYPVLDYIDIYTFSRQKQVSHKSLGDKYPFDARMLEYHENLIPINFKSGDKKTLYFRITSTSSLQIPIHLWSSSAMIEKVQGKSKGLGLYYGTLLVMLFYNLFIYISAREASYLYYVCFVGCIGLFLSSLNGISFQYLWPNAVWWNDRSLLVSMCFALIFGLLFANHFLKLPQHKPLASKFIMVVNCICFATAVISLFAPYRIMVQVIIFETLLAISIATPLGIIRWIEGDRSAKYYSISWMTLLFGGIMLALNKFGALPRNALTENSAQIGSALELVLLSLAMADRLNTEKRARFVAQQKLLRNERLLRESQEETLAKEQQARQANEKALELEKATRAAQEEALHAQRRANETLEERVAERTQELKKANQKLEQLSFSDGLTGIRNRRYLNREMEMEFKRASRDQQPLSMLLLDIDFFKKVNDDYGHLAGDDCLRAVAHTIRGQIHRDADVVARYGGEEFAVLMPNTDAAGAKHIAELIRERVEDLNFCYEGQNIPTTISIGGATLIPKSDSSQDTFITAVDNALYESKENGRNRVTMASLDE